MFINANTVPQNVSLHADVCIVGAGAAGIAIAKEFANTQYKVLLVESGGLQFDHRTQFLYRAENIGREYQPMEFTKRRQFGGTTITWFGRCRPLDEIDFEARPWVAHSGWPFDKAHLDPFYVRARTYLQLASDDYSITNEFFRNGSVETKRFYFSPPTNFAETYKDDLEQAKNVDVLLHANVTRIHLASDGRQVNRIVCKTLRGKTFDMSAQTFILAASAIENTKLLLASRDVHPNGIGNQYDLVGRYFMEHPHLFGGEVQEFPAGFPAQFTKLNYDFAQKNIDVVDALGLSQGVMRREQLLNASAFLVSRPAHKADELYHSQRIIGLLRIMDSLQHRAPPMQDLLKNAAHVLQNAGPVTSLIRSALKGRGKKQRKFVIRYQVETVPHPESRVILSENRDALGEPQAALQWQTLPQDVESYQHFDEFLRNELKREGVRVKPFRHDLSPDGWPVSMLPAKHAMGTTRMHKNEKQGVVDEHCRVHGVANLYIAGGSIFPTSGMANPTLTIVALAIRLADHVKRNL